MPKYIIISALFAMLGSTAAHAGTVENLERERALVVEKILNPALTPDERSQSLVPSKARLVDLERMVLRDKSLKGRNTPTVRKAFENYDLTFLVHASTERNLSLTDNWLTQMGITTHNIMSATIRNR